MHDVNIVAKTWQGLLQVLVSQIGRGYFFAQVVEYPERKRHKWHLLDGKMVNRFGAGLSKYQRARAKNKGLANFFVVRWDRLLVILCTEGQKPAGIDLSGERFLDVRRGPVKLPIGQFLVLQIIRNSKVEVCIAPETYQGIKDI